MKRKKLIRIILLIDIALWAFIIFKLSGQVGNDSSNLSRMITSFFFKNEATVDIVEPYVRKIAHFSEYGFGGILFITLFNTYDEWTDKKKIVTSIALGIWYAVLDEIHQLMVIGRTGSVKDVCIDTLGFSTGVIGMMILFKIYAIKKNKKKKRRKKND